MKLGKVTSVDPAERLNVTFHKSTASKLEAYRTYYQHVHGEEISMSLLLEEMVKSFLKDDKKFALFLSNKNAPAAPGTAAAPAAAPPNGNDPSRSSAADRK